MANKPTHRAFLVADPSDDTKKARWTEVGAVWPHGKGEGFDLVLPPGLAVSGRIVCMPVTEEATAD